jgi:DNA invertase Pin-like site-specific DNA recombinase
MNKKPTAFIYARRSNEKNKLTSVSVPIQKENLTRVCNEQNIEVIDAFWEIKSAYKKGKRDEFNRMLDEVVSRNIKWKWARIDYIYVYFVSRLARNFEEWDLLKKLVMDDVIQIKSIQETSFDTTTIDGKQKLVELMSNAVFESAKKSRDAIINMDSTFIRGRIGTKLPYGYIRIGSGDNRKIILDTNHKASDVVRECFELYATGKYTFESLFQEINKRWFRRYTYYKGNELVRPFKKKDIENILDNPIYYWRVLVKYTNLWNEATKALQQNHPDMDIDKNWAVEIDYTHFFEQISSLPKIISKDLFDKCEAVKDGKTLWVHGKWNENGEIYLWKDILRCPCKDMDHPEEYKTLRFFTAETKKEKYHYYRCSCNSKSECENTRISWTTLDNMIFDSIISQLKMNNVEIAILEKVVRFELEKQWKLKVDTRVNITQELWRMKAEKERLTKRYWDEEDEELAEELGILIKQARQKIGVLENMLANTDDVFEYNKEQMEEILKYAKGLTTDFHSFPQRKKQHILAAIFKTIVIYKGEILYFELKPLFNGIYQRAVLTGQKNDKTPKNDSSNSSDLNSKRRTLLFEKLNPNGWGTRIRT